MGDRWLKYVILLPGASSFMLPGALCGWEAWPATVQKSPLCPILSPFCLLFFKKKEAVRLLLEAALPGNGC